MLDERKGIPKVRNLGRAELTTLDFGLLKFAARAIETRHRVCIAFATACPEADVIGGLSALLGAGSNRRS